MASPRAFLLRRRPRDRSSEPLRPFVRRAARESLVRLATRRPKRGFGPARATPESLSSRPSLLLARPRTPSEPSREPRPSPPASLGLSDACANESGSRLPAPRFLRPRRHVSRLLSSRLASRLGWGPRHARPFVSGGRRVRPGDPKRRAGARSRVASASPPLEVDRTGSGNAPVSFDRTPIGPSHAARST